MTGPPDPRLWVRCRGKGLTPGSEGRLRVKGQRLEKGFVGRRVAKRRSFTRRSPCIQNLSPAAHPLCCLRGVMGAARAGMREFVGLKYLRRSMTGRP